MAHEQRQVELSPEVSPFQEAQGAPLVADTCHPASQCMADPARSKIQKTKKLLMASLAT